MPRLFTPGPVEVPEAALLAMARQVRHHRTPEFRRTMAEVFAGLKYVFQTANDVLVLASSGTGGMEAAVVNTVPRGGKALVLESGKFAERWRLIAERFGIEVVRYELPWGDAFEAAEVARSLAEHPDTAAVFATLQETSTGAGHDIEAIGRVVRDTPALYVVDGISGVGAMECRTDDWGIDVLVVGSQKALMTPPGLAFLAVSPKAWRRIEAIDRPAFYFELLAYREAAKANETPYTPAIPLIEALAESLRLIRAEGIENVWARSRRLSRAVLAGIAAFGSAPGGQAAGGRRLGRLSARSDRRQGFPRAAGSAVRHQARGRARAAQGPDLSHRADGPDRRDRHPRLPCGDRVGSAGNGSCCDVGVGSCCGRIVACGFVQSIAANLTAEREEHDFAPCLLAVTVFACRQSSRPKTGKVDKSRQKEALDWPFYSYCWWCLSSYR